MCDEVIPKIELDNKSKKILEVVKKTKYGECYIKVKEDYESLKIKSMWLSVIILKKKNH